MSDPISLEEEYSPELKAAIGTLFLSASAGESALSMQLARLIAHPNQPCPTGNLSVWGMDVSVKIIQLKTVGRLKLSVNHSNSLARICRKLRLSYSRRNEFAHYCNSPDAAPDKISLIALKSKSDGGIQPRKLYSEQQILEFARTLHFRVKAVDDLLNEAGIRPLTEYEMPGT